MKRLKAQTHIGRMFIGVYSRDYKEETMDNNVTKIGLCLAMLLVLVPVPVPGSMSYMHTHPCISCTVEVLGIGRFLYRYSSSSTFNGW